MKGVKILFVLSIFMAGSAFAQTTRYGDPNWVAENDWRSGNPVVLTVSTEDQGYKFDGGILQIPFTLSGTQANVWLAVYTKDANPQYGGDPFGSGGINNAVLRAAGVDTMVALTAGEAFSEGSHTISWDGKDWTGAQVPMGTYDFYLFAMDIVSNPTWTGRGSAPSVWSSRQFDTRFDPIRAWTSRVDPPTLQFTPVGVDLFENPDAHTEIEMEWMRERLRELKEDYGDGDQWDVGWFEIDVDDPDVAIVGQYGTGATTNLAGYWKVNIDLDNLTALPDESWGDDRGYVSWEMRLFDSARINDFHHPWGVDDGMIYLSWMDRADPKTPGVLVVDRATGAIVNQLDLTDLYLGSRDDGATTYTPGPSGIDVDDDGIYLTAYWMDSTNGFPSRITHDGDIVWRNENGDGFVDRFLAEEAEALGVVVIDQMVNTHITVGRYGIVYGGGYNDPSWGYVLGPDGSGIFKLNLPKMPSRLGGEVQFIDNDSYADGLWISMDGSAVVHWPYDVARATISEGVSTAIAAIAGATPESSDLGDNYPNPFNPDTAIQIAVSELDLAAATIVTVHNAAGQEIARLVDEQLAPGLYNVTWDGRNAQGDAVASGVYLYKMTVGQHFTQTKRMTLLK